MRASDAQPILDAFGYLQHGLVTSAQAADSGVDTTTMTRLFQRDVIRRVRRGVYILAGVAEDSLTEIRAAWLSTSPRILGEDRLKDESPIVVSHVSAASVLNLGDITPAVHTFTSSLRKQTSAADIRHRMASIPTSDITVIEGIPVTSPIRTITDLAKDHLDGDQLHHAIADAIHDHRVKISDLAQALFSHSHNYGHSSGEELIAESIRRFPADASSTEASQFSALVQALGNPSNGVFENPMAALNRELHTSILKSSLADSYMNMARPIIGSFPDPPWKSAMQKNAELLAEISGSFPSFAIPALDTTSQLSEIMQTISPKINWDLIWGDIADNKGETAANHNDAKGDDE